jgi:hypothetical protein
MGKHSMMGSTKSIRATRTDTPAIIQSLEEIGRRLQWNGRSLGWSAHNCAGRHIRQIGGSRVVLR